MQEGADKNFYTVSAAYRWRTGIPQKEDCGRPYAEPAKRDNGLIS